MLPLVLRAIRRYTRAIRVNWYLHVCLLVMRRLALGPRRGLGGATKLSFFLLFNQICIPESAPEALHASWHRALVDSASWLTGQAHRRGNAGNDDQSLHLAKQGNSFGGQGKMGRHGAPVKSTEYPNIRKLRMAGACELETMYRCRPGSSGQEGGGKSAGLHFRTHQKTSTPCAQ